MQKSNCRLFHGCIYLAFSVASVQSTRQRPGHFLIGNATLSGTAPLDIPSSYGADTDESPFVYKGIKGGPACIVGGSNTSTSPQIQVFIRHDNIRSLSFGTGYTEHTSLGCKGEVENYCTSWTSNSEPRESNRSCEALVEECTCETDDTRLISKAHQRVTQDIRQMCYEAPDHRDLYTDPFRILIIGLSSGALPMYLMANCRIFTPGGLKLHIVEPDPRVLDVARDLFGFTAMPSVADIENDDPKKAILELLLMPDHKMYDVIIIDLFDGDGGVPDSVQGPAFLEGIDRLLRPGARAMQYVPSSEYNQTMANYVTVFGKDYLQEYTTGMSSEEGPEHVIVAHGPPLLAKSSTSAVGQALVVVTLYIISIISQL